jgi:transcriptional regulator with XRE-family HTH domain
VLKSIHSRLSEICCEHIRELRQKAGMTQRDLAAALGREHGMIARIELGERRVDLVEAYELFRALKADPAAEIAVLMRKFDTAMQTDVSGRG